MQTFVTMYQISQSIKYELTNIILFNYVVQSNERIIYKWDENIVLNRKRKVTLLTNTNQLIARSFTWNFSISRSYDYFLSIKCLDSLKKRNQTCCLTSRWFISLWTIISMWCSIISMWCCIMCYCNSSFSWLRRKIISSLWSRLISVVSLVW